MAAIGELADPQVVHLAVEQQRRADAERAYQQSLAASAVSRRDREQRASAALGGWPSAAAAAAATVAGVQELVRQVREQPS